MPSNIEAESANLSLISAKLGPNLIQVDQGLPGSDRSWCELCQSSLAVGQILATRGRFMEQRGVLVFRALLNLHALTFPLASFACSFNCCLFGWPLLGQCGHCNRCTAWAAPEGKIRECLVAVHLAAGPGAIRAPGSLSRRGRPSSDLAEIWRRFEGIEPPSKMLCWRGRQAAAE